MRESRRHETTDLIRRAARAEFVSSGPRALSLQDVARRAYVSIGAVYQRYPNKEACLAALVEVDLPEIVDFLNQPWANEDTLLEDLVELDFTDPERLDALRFVAECAFAARDDCALRPAVVDAIMALADARAARVPNVDALGCMAWWIGSTWLATGLLRTAGCPIPPSSDTEAASIMAGLGLAAVQPAAVDITTQHVIDHPPLERAPSAADNTTQALIGAAHRVLHEQGAHGADTRSIAREAGVTTGAIYRRFPGRSEVLAKAFVASLDTERYAWTQPMLDVLDQHGLDGGAAYLAELATRIWTDQSTAHALLEYSVAAHTDTLVLQAINSEIVKVASNRTSLFQSLVSAGVARADLSPDGTAWMFQVPPIGMRLCASIGITPSQESLEQLLRAYLLYLMVEG